jgi:ABC-type multidrug transport system permease subunit
VELIVPFVFIIVAYFACNLRGGAETFFWAWLTLELVHFYSASLSLLVSTLIADLSIAMALTPSLVIPFMLVGGFFNNLT